MRREQSSGRDFHPGLQWLRAAAALMVVCHHLGHSKALSGAAQQMLLRYTEPLSAGVDLFFVISGFVMAKCWGASAKGTPTPVAFLARRWARVLPLYWLCTGAVLVAALLLPRVALAPQGGGGYDWGLSALLFPTGHFPPLKVGWSLVHENYFYLVFALTLFLPVRWRLPSVLGWGAVTLLAHSAFSTAPLLGVAGVLTSPLTLEFVAGVVIGASVGRLRIMWGRAWVGVACAAFFGLAVVGCGEGYAVEADNTLGLARLFHWGVPAMLLVASMAAPASSGRFSGGRWALLLGDASYAMYLVHLFVLAVVGRLLLPAGEGDAHGWLWRYPLCLGAVVVASLAVHLLVEKPLHEALLARLRRGAAKAA